MKIQTDEYDGNKEQELTEYITQKLRDNYGDNMGALEEAQNQVDKVIEAFARLIDVLSERGMFTPDNVQFIAEGHFDGKAEFTKEGE